MSPEPLSTEVVMVPVGVHFDAKRTSQGHQYSRSLRLEWSCNGSIYLTEHEYGGRSICPTMEELRWLRDVLNKLEFCDHDLGEIHRGNRKCKKCGVYLREGSVEQKFTYG